MYTCADRTSFCLAQHLSVYARRSCEQMSLGRTCSEQQLTRRCALERFNLLITFRSSSTAADNEQCVFHARHTHSSSSLSLSLRNVSLRFLLFRCVSPGHIAVDAPKKQRGVPSVRSKRARSFRLRLALILSASAQFCFTLLLRESRANVRPSTASEARSAATHQCVFLRVRRTLE